MSVTRARRTRPSRRSRSAALLITVAVLAACSGDDDTAVPTTPPTTQPATTTTTEPPPTTTTTTEPLTTTTTTTVPEPVEVLRMPLTGVPIDDESEIPQRPALAVKIDNHARARPQSGLNEADLVFEANVEGITRFAAVFHSGDTDLLGPIRSGRSQDVAIVSGFNTPLFAWSGGNAGVRALINAADLVNLDAGFTPGYYRRSGRGGAPYNLYSSTEALWANTPETWSVPPQIFPYLPPDEAVGGDPATSVTVPMLGLRVRWEYDADTGSYFRFQNDSAHQTELSGQVRTENVIALGVEYLRSPVDGGPDANTIGFGPVLVFSAGTVRSGIWVREDITSPYSFELDDGEILGLVPGRTFVELVNRDTHPELATWE